MSDAPLVSIVVATYNSSHLLRYAIRSVLDSTLTDWEMVIVGDACTDDTAAVVRSFGDPRLVFSNLTENSGDQAVPNNHGLTRARGRYVAFLNQDDMYFPDHLQRSIDALERSGVDLVWGPCAAIQPATEAELARDEWTAELLGVPPAPTYSPCAFYCASSWMMRRELSARVGPWRTVDELWVTPSQDWLFRAWRSGATLRFRDHVSVLVIASGLRRNSYVDRPTYQHAYFALKMRDPTFRARLLEAAAIRTAQSHLHRLFQRPVAGILRGLAYPLYALLTRAGTHPFSANAMFWIDGRPGLGWRGQGVRAIRRFTGLR